MDIQPHDRTGPPPPDRRDVSPEWPEHVTGLEEWWASLAYAHITWAGEPHGERVDRDVVHTVAVQGGEDACRIQRHRRAVR